MRTLALLLLAALLAFGQNPNTAVFPGSIATDSDLLVASNLASTVTTASVTAVSTSISVSSTSTFIVPTTITFADTGEIVKCTAKTASSFTSCTRGFDSGAGGVAASAHASGVTVRGNAVAHYFNQLAVELIAAETAIAAAVTNPMTSLGDTLYGGTAGAVSRLAGDTSNTRKFLRELSVTSVATAPVWDTLLAADIPTLNQSTTGNAATATTLAANPTETGCSATTPTTVTAIDASGNLTCTSIQVATGSLPGVLSAADFTTFNAKVAATRSISTTSPLSGGGDLSADRTLTIADAAADGTTKGAAAFTAADFNAALGVISIDYTNGQAASGSTKGFLTSADWTTFNGKLSSAFYQTVQEEGSDLTQRNKLNFVGSTITCADATTVTTCTLTPKNRQLTLVVGAPTSTGVKACSVAEVAYTIVAAHLIADALPTGANLVVDVKKVAFTSYTGTASASSITASAVPTIATTDTNPRYEDTTLTGWTTSIAANDVVCVSISTAPSGGSSWASLTLEVQ